MFEEFIYIIIKWFYEHANGVVIFFEFLGWFRFDIRSIWKQTIVFVRYILVVHFKKVFYLGFNLFFVIILWTEI